MSLDFYLVSQKPERKMCYSCGYENDQYETIFSRNITHNLGEMASEAGVYEALWRPEEIGCTFAREIIPILKIGLKKLKANPAKYEAFNASNGWGTYEHFVPFVEECLKACEENPDTKIKVSR